MFADNLGSIWNSAGGFAYPLLGLSCVATWVVVDRCRALRPCRFFAPQHWLAFLEKGPAGLQHTAQTGTLGARLVAFWLQQRPSPESFRALAQLELSHLERGFFWLETVIAAAPLLGLLGTVTGLIRLFGDMAAQGQPAGSADAFVPGIALALSTTMLGLAVAIPTVVAYYALRRRLDVMAAYTEVLVKRLIDSGAAAAGPGPTSR